MSRKYILNSYTHPKTQEGLKLSFGLQYEKLCCLPNLGRMYQMKMTISDGIILFYIIASEVISGDNMTR
jgi:hypothetical protein